MRVPGLRRSRLFGISLFSADRIPKEECDRFSARADLPLRPDSITPLLSQWDFNPKLRSLTGCRNTPQLTTMFLDNNVIAD